MLHVVKKAEENNIMVERTGRYKKGQTGTSRNEKYCI